MDIQPQPQGQLVSASAEAPPGTLDEYDEAQEYLRRYRSPKARRALQMMGWLRMTVAIITVNMLFYGPVGQIVVCFVQILWLFTEAWAAGYSDEQLLVYVNALSVVSTHEAATQREILRALKAHGLMPPPESLPTRAP